MGEAEDAIEAKIQEINRSLETISLRRKGDKLYVRGRQFPPRPGQTEAVREEFALGGNATLAGLRLAKLKAQEIDNQVLWGKFDWNPYLKGKHKPATTVGEWVERYEAAHWQTTQRTPSKDSSYHNNYRLIFRRLPQAELLTLDLLKRTLLQESEPETRSREVFCMAYRRLAEFMKRQGTIDAEVFEGFRLEVLKLSRGYEPKPVNPEDLPTEAQIVELWHGIKQPGWKWVYGMLATYGLRPHEIFNLDVERFTRKTEALRVFDTTKTGQRLAYPCPSAWRERFKLWDVQLPDIQAEGKSNKDLGRKVSQEFREQKIWHNPYDLRHAWCIRTALLGVPDGVAARWAGHSVAVRTKIYLQAISESQHQGVFERMKSEELRGDRD